MTYCSNCGKELPADASFCPACGAQVTGAGAAVQQPVSGFDTVFREKKAQDYWARRLIAFFVDCAIVYGALLVVTLLFAVPIFFVSGVATAVSVMGSVFSIVPGVLLLFYFAVSESVSGASPGKHMFGLKVRNPSGGSPNFVQALIRNVSKIYWVLLLLDVVIGLATSKGYTRKLSDRYVGTDVL